MRSGGLRPQRLCRMSKLRCTSTQLVPEARRRHAPRAGSMPSCGRLRLVVGGRWPDRVRDGRLRIPPLVRQRRSLSTGLGREGIPNPDLGHDAVHVAGETQFRVPCCVDNTQALAAVSRGYSKKLRHSAKTHEISVGFLHRSDRPRHEYYDDALSHACEQGRHVPEELARTSVRERARAPLWVWASGVNTHAEETRP